MSRIPAWLYVLFGLIAIVAGILGVIHAPSGAPKIFNGVLTIIGLASLYAGWSAYRSTQRT